MNLVRKYSYFLSASTQLFHETEVCIHLTCFQMSFIGVFLFRLLQWWFFIKLSFFLNSFKDSCFSLYFNVSCVIFVELVVSESFLHLWIPLVHWAFHHWQAKWWTYICINIGLYFRISKWHTSPIRFMKVWCVRFYW